MTLDEAAVTGAFLEHLTDDDVALLAGTGAGALSPRQLRASLAGRGGGVQDLLAGDGAFRSVFGRRRDDDRLMLASPFLLFAVAVERTNRGLAGVSYVDEWSGVGRRTPVFDVGRLREFMSSPWCRLFLAELLASFSRVASGSVLVAGRRGMRRQRYSELDPVQIAGLLDVVPEAERPGVLRRLGDVCLFLTGVFPDHVARRGLRPSEERKLLVAGGQGPAPPSADAGGAFQILEQLGRRCYQAAFETIPRPVTSSSAVLGEIAERFGDARRVLALVSERFLFPYRDHWFGVAPG